MSILEEFKQGVFKPDQEEKKNIEEGDAKLEEKFCQANANLEAKRAKKEDERKNFTEEFCLNEINGFELITCKDIDNFIEFVKKRNNQLTEEEKEILKNEIIKKTEKIITDKLEQTS
ncbi:MAG: hypothetical protein V1825_01655 [Candidatus Falkowbacteria bacterium]|nr:hypothetical protein [Candidatus Parcubacteria bacterium]